MIKLNEIVSGQTVVCLVNNKEKEYEIVDTSARMKFNGTWYHCITYRPKEVADAAYFPLNPANDGTKILKEDVEKFITNVEVMTVGEKTTVVNAHTLTGFDVVKHSSCVDPKNYSEELGKQYAMEEVTNTIWGHLGFVLQWAKDGLKGHKQEDK